MKIILILQSIGLLLCLITGLILNSIATVLWIQIFSTLSMSFISPVLGFCAYDIYKQWKKLK